MIGLIFSLINLLLLVGATMLAIISLKAIGFPDFLILYVALIIGLVTMAGIDILFFKFLDKLEGKKNKDSDPKAVKKSPER